MKRPAFIEALEKMAIYDKDTGLTPYWGLTNPDSILELLRYVKVLERAFANAIEDGIQQDAEMDSLAAYIEVASDELTESESN